MKTRHSMGTSVLRFAAASSIALGTLAYASSASAQTRFAERWALHLEGGLGSMLSDAQQHAGYNFGLQGGLRVGFTVWHPVVLQLAVANWFFPADSMSPAGGPGGAVLLGGGLRFEPFVGTVGRLFVDGDVGVAFTGDQRRTMIDIGLGFEAAVTPWLGIGPVLRYGRVIAQGADIPADAQFWAIGVSIAPRFPPSPPPPVVIIAPPDADHDTVLDPVDQCPEVIAGEHPDPDRLGCPDGDEDHDTILDHGDACRTEAAGTHPDPARPGCPLPDRDHDNVPDPTDGCPDAAPGDHPDPDRAGCPDGDQDSDGVLDHGDQCRAEPAGAHPDPARAGCPLPDGDGDGIPDATDHCPAQAGAPNADPNRNGCPGLVIISRTEIRITQQVFFATNTDRIQPRSFPVLQAVADALRAMPEIRRVSVEGHTDDAGDATANMTLSQRRADAVVQWLSAHGVEAARLESHGFGSTQPIQQGRTAAARAANRRVQFRLVGSSGAASSAAP